ncbi:hypothetical protein Tco_0366222 [Tanacetum coccineum]
MSPVVDEPVVVAGNNKGTEDGNVGHGVTLITIIAPNTGCVPYTIHDSPTTDNYALIRSGPTSYAKLVTGEPSSKSVNFRTLIAPARKETGLMSSYAKAMIELRADEELKDTIVVVMLKLVIEGIYMCTIRVNYEWKPLSNTPIIEKIDKLERQILDGKLMFVVDDRKPLYRRWLIGTMEGEKRDDDDLYESHDMSENLQGICDDFDVTVRGRKKK